MTVEFEKKIDEILKWVKAIGADIYKIKEHLEIDQKEETYSMLRTGTSEEYLTGTSEEYLTFAGTGGWYGIPVDSRTKELEEDTEEAND